MDSGNLNESNCFILDKKNIVEKPTNIYINFKPWHSEYPVYDENNNLIYKYKIGTNYREHKIKDVNDNVLVTFNIDRGISRKDKKLIIEFNGLKNQPTISFTDTSSVKNISFSINILNNEDNKEYLLNVVSDKKKEKLYIYDDTKKDNEQYLCSYERHTLNTNKDKWPLEIAPGMDKLFMISIALSSFLLIDRINTVASSLVMLL